MTRLLRVSSVATILLFLFSLAGARPYSGKAVAGNTECTTSECYSYSYCDTVTDDICHATNWDFECCCGPFEPE